MSSSHPSFTVEYSPRDAGTFTGEQTDVSVDVISGNIELLELKQGISNFKIVLNNKDAKYDDLLPESGETGLYDFWRFKINGYIIQMFRADSIEPVDESGETIEISGFSLINEAQRKKVPTKAYRTYKVDDLVAQILSDAGVTQIEYISGSSGTIIPNWEAPSTGKVPVVDALKDLSEEQEYDCYDDSRLFSKGIAKGSLIFLPKADSSYRLNLVLRSNIKDETNNCVTIRRPRTLNDVYNYLTLEGNQDFNRCLPADLDSWTTSLTYGTETIWACWDDLLNVEISLENTDKYPVDSNICSIKLSAKSPGHYPNGELDLKKSEYGQYLNIEDLGLAHFNFYHKESHAPGGSTYKVWLIDSGDVRIYQTFSLKATPWTSNKETFNVGSAHKAEWTWDPAGSGGSVDDFDWTEVEKIRFRAEGVINYSLIDFLHFDWSTVSTASLSDFASMTAYDQRDAELTKPNGWRWMDLYTWGTQMLAMLAWPTRMVSVALAKFNPADLTGPTYPQLLPTYQCQVEMDRYGIKTVANGGIWWRITRVVHNWDASGWSVEVDVVPSGSESPIDYSHVSGAKLQILRSPNEAFIASLQRKILKLAPGVPELTTYIGQMADNWKIITLYSPYNRSYFENFQDAVDAT